MTILAYGTFAVHRHNSVEAQSCPPSCADDCPQEDAGDSCSNDMETDCAWQGPTDYCRYSSGCSSNTDQIQGTCCYQVRSPIVVDTSGQGFSLTSAVRGVRFPITDTAKMYPVSWTAPLVHNSWLALDRNGNGRIDNGSELFGNYTSQPAPEKGSVRNGFAALAVFDLPANGGNGDGIINAQDAIYSKLLLWEDTNHDGYSQPSELSSLQSKGIEGIDLSYKLSRRKDGFGNVFHFQSRLYHSFGFPDGRTAWDVYLVSR